MVAKKKHLTSTKRSRNIRSTRKKFVLACEGRKTEPTYFTKLKEIVNNPLINIIPLTGSTKSAPLHLLERIKDYITKKGIDEQDEAWIVMDRDHWKQDDIREVIKWSQENEEYGLALTNPKFEYWLLLHFEDGKSVQTSNDCSSRLKNHLPGYKKSLSTNDFNINNVQKAVNLVEKKAQLSNEDLINEVGTTVHVLVNNIINSKKNK